MGIMQIRTTLIPVCRLPASIWLGSIPCGMSYLLYILQDRSEGETIRLSCKKSGHMHAMTGLM